jgi:phosphoglycolate phosphatase-like HAD superfamily hydrolase
MESARAARVFAVGVTWGGIHEPGALAGADVVVDTPEALLAVL